ncbi:hypothetical protein [Bradyrhizobium sp.]|uniref:hypothetical protein n=1 Tax=Bradyrhizobium sp. TaxID=376 RepID=UPI002613E747|nr:hypothetical protein [Bradyrhizobium sp.]
MPLARGSGLGWRSSSRGGPELRVPFNDPRNLWKISQESPEALAKWKQIAFRGLGMPSLDRTDGQGTEAAMNSSQHTGGEIDLLDHKSSLAICDAVGERLQQLLPAESTGPSSHLQHLVAELRSRDQAGGRDSH